MTIKTTLFSLVLFFLSTNLFAAEKFFTTDGIKHKSSMSFSGGSADTSYISPKNKDIYKLTGSSYTINILFQRRDAIDNKKFYIFRGLDNGGNIAFEIGFDANNRFFMSHGAESGSSTNAVYSTKYEISELQNIPKIVNITYNNPLKKLTLIVDGNEVGSQTGVSSISLKAKKLEYGKGFYGYVGKHEFYNTKIAIADLNILTKKIASKAKVENETGLSLSKISNTTILKCKFGEKPYKGTCKKITCKMPYGLPSTTEEVNKDAKIVACSTGKKFKARNIQYICDKTGVLNIQSSDKKCDCEIGYGIDSAKVKCDPREYTVIFPNSTAPSGKVSFVVGKISDTTLAATYSCNANHAVKPVGGVIKPVGHYFDSTTGDIKISGNCTKYTTLTASLPTDAVIPVNNRVSGVTNGIFINSGATETASAIAFECNNDKVPDVLLKYYFTGNTVNLVSGGKCVAPKVVKIFSAMRAFASLNENGGVVTWGYDPDGGNMNPDGNGSSSIKEALKKDVDRIYTSDTGFIAIKKDRTVISWGYDFSPGDAILASLKIGSPIKTIYNNGSAFAVLREDGTIVVWGSINNGGDITGLDLTNIKEIITGANTFAALKNDGSLITWGSVNTGGNKGSVDNAKIIPFSAVKDQLTSNVVKVYGSQSSFAALKSDGSVITWGNKEWGGAGTANSGNASSNLVPSNATLTNIKEVIHTQMSYAAIKNDGTVVTWGREVKVGDNWGRFPSGGLSNVAKIYANSNSFIAVDANGTAIHGWGASIDDNVASHNPNVPYDKDLKNIKKIYSKTLDPLNGRIQYNAGEGAFAILKNDGNVIVLGSSNGAFNNYPSSNLTNSDPKSALTNVKDIIGTGWGFIAIKNDGSIVTWGKSDWAVADAATEAKANTNGGVDNVFCHSYACAAIKKDGTVVTWGNQSQGGDSSKAFP